MSSEKKDENNNLNNLNIENNINNKSNINFITNTSNDNNNITLNLRHTKKINYEEEFLDNENSDDYNDKEEISRQRLSSNKRKRNKINYQSPDKIIFNIHNTNNLNDNINNINYNNLSEKNPSQSSNTKEIYNNYLYGNIINLEDLSNKKKPLQNTEIILAIMEICLNSSKYGINLDNSSRNFWEKIGEREDIFSVIKQFKPETLRKYWRRLRTTNKYKNIIQIINQKKDKLNGNNMKLLSSINAISDYVLFPSKGLDFFIQKYSIKHNGRNDYTYFYNRNKNKININFIVEDIIDNFYKIFPNKDKENIYNILYSVNGNIEKAYLILQNENCFNYLGFDNEDDKKILDENFINDDKLYINFAKIKGHENILERKKFLLNENINKEDENIITIENPEEENNCFIEESEKIN